MDDPKSPSAVQYPAKRHKGDPSIPPMIVAAFFKCEGKNATGPMVLGQIEDNGISVIRPSLVTESQNKLKALVHFHMQQYLTTPFTTRPVTSPTWATLVISGPFSEDEYEKFRDDLLLVAAALEISHEGTGSQVVYAPIKCQPVAPQQFSFSLKEKCLDDHYDQKGYGGMEHTVHRFASPVLRIPGFYMLFVSRRCCYKKLTPYKIFIATSAHGMSPSPYAVSYDRDFLEEIQVAAQKQHNFPKEATVHTTTTVGFIAVGPITRSTEEEFESFADDFMWQVEEVVSEGVHAVTVQVTEDGVHRVTGTSDLSIRRASMLQRYSFIPPSRRSIPDDNSSAASE